MAEGRSYRELPAWQKGIDFVEAVYQATEGWPKGEMHGLANQLRRAAVSIPASVAAGQGRGTVAGFLDRLAVALDALHEAQTHLQVARRLAYLDEPAYTTLLEQAAEIGRLLQAMRDRLLATSGAPHGTNGHRGPAVE